MIYFTSDLHFYHKFMAEHRKYLSVDSMNCDILNKINSRVSINDELYILGDLSFGNVENTSHILSQMNGIKYLIKGNHDNEKKLRKLSSYFAWIKDYHLMKLTDNDIKYHLIMSHYPLLTWDRAHHGTWHIHGHCHGTLIAPITTRLDIGWDIKKDVFTFDDIRHIMANRKYTSVDHHT